MWIKSFSPILLSKQLPIVRNVMDHLARELRHTDKFPIYMQVRLYKLEHEGWIEAFVSVMTANVKVTLLLLQCEGVKVNNWQSEIKQENHLLILVVRNGEILSCCMRDN
jgi:hypothetical protein